MASDLDDVCDDGKCERCGKPRESEQWAHCNSCQKERRFEDAVESIWRYGEPPPWVAELLEEVASLVDDFAHMRKPTSYLFDLPRVKQMLLPYM